MDNNKLALGGIITVGVLASSLVIGADMPTGATTLEPELNMNKSMPHEIILDSYPDNFRTTPLFSLQYDLIKIGSNIEEDAYPEIEVIEIPVAKRIVFQFNKPVPLEFS